MLKGLIDFIHSFNAKRELKKITPFLLNDVKKCSNSDEIVDLVLNKYQKYFWIKQVPEEIKALAKVVEYLKPKILVEIGTAGGGSLFIFTQLAVIGAKIASIDLPLGLFGGAYPEYRKNFYNSFANNGKKMRLIREDSHLIQTKRELENYLCGEKIDFLMIDGDHTYEGVKRDFEMYKEFVRNGGIIAFHDILPHEKGSLCTVDLFWNEVKKEYTYKEIIHDQDQKWAGIGIIEYEN